MVQTWQKPKTSRLEHVTFALSSNPSNVLTKSGSICSLCSTMYGMLHKARAAIDKATVMMRLLRLAVGASALCSST